MSRFRKNKKRIDPRYFLSETTNRDYSSAVSMVDPKHDPKEHPSRGTIQSPSNTFKDLKGVTWDIDIAPGRVGQATQNISIRIGVPKGSALNPSGRDKDYEKVIQGAFPADRARLQRLFAAEDNEALMMAYDIIKKG